jgi:hypothetical protein
MTDITQTLHAATAATRRLEAAKHPPRRKAPLTTAQRATHRARFQKWDGISREAEEYLRPSKAFGRGPK